MPRALSPHRRRRFDVVLAVDGANVLALAVLAVGRRSCVAVPPGVPLVAVASWTFAAAARPALGGRGTARARVRLARRLVARGAVVNTVGSTLLTAAARRTGAGAASCLYLLVGGAAVSAAYRRALRR